MSDIATLALKVDSSSVPEGVKQLDNLEKAGARAEQQTQKLGITTEQAQRYMQKASVVLGDMKAKEEAAALAAQKLSQAQQSVAAAGTKVVQSAGAQRAGMQQLGYQLGDIAQGFASGQKAAQIFAQQGAQVVQSISLMAKEGSALAGFLGGPWGIAVTVAATVLGPLIASLFDTSSALQKVRDDANDAIKALSGLGDAGTIGKIAQAAGELGRLRDEQTALERKLAGVGLTDANGFKGANQPYYQANIRQLYELRQKVLAAQDAINQGNKALDDQAAKLDKSTAAHATATGAVRAHTAAVHADKNKISEAEKAAQDALGTAKSYANGLAEETARLGLNSEQLKQREATMQATAAAMAALTAPTEDLRKQLLAESIAITANYEAWKKRNDEINRAGEVGNIVSDAMEKLNAANSKNTDGFAEGMRKDAEAAERLNEQFREMAQLLDNLGGAGKVLGSLLAITSGNYSSVASGPLGDLLSFVLNSTTGKTNTKGEAEVIGDVLQDKLGEVLKRVFGDNGDFQQALSQALQSAGLGMAGASAVFGHQNTAESIGSALGGIVGKEAGKEFLKFLGPLAGPVGSIIGGILGGALGGLIGGSKKGSVTLNGMSITGTRYGNDARLDAANQNATSIIDSLTRIADALGGTLGSVSGVSIGMRNDKWRVDPTGQGRVKGPGVLDFGDDAEAAAMAAMKLLIERGVIGGIRASTQNVLKAGTDLEAQINKALAWESILKEAEHASSSFSSALKDLQDSFVEINKIAIEAKASTEELAEVQGLLIRKQQELIDQAMQSYRSTFYTDAENVAYAKKTISSTLTPLGYGNVDTVEEYKALVAATDALKDPELFGALMDLSDEFGVLKDSADQAKAAAEQQAAQEKALAAQRGQLTVQILQAQGKAAEALAKQRALELDAADPSLRGLLQQLYKAQDIAAAKDALSDAYKRESAALQDVIDQTDKAVETWQAFSDSLAGTTATAASTSALLVKFMAAASSADTSDPSKLTGAGTAYLDALRNTATSYTQYQRGVGVVRGMTAQAIGTAAQQGTVAQQQLDQMKTQVGALIDINESVLSVEDAIERLTALVDPATPTGGGLGGHTANDKLDKLHDRLKDVVDGLRELAGRNDRWGARHSDLLSDVKRQWEQMRSPDGRGVLMKTDPEFPLDVAP